MNQEKSVADNIVNMNSMLFSIGSESGERIKTLSKVFYKQYGFFKMAKCDKNTYFGTQCIYLAIEVYH